MKEKSRSIKHSKLEKYFKSYALIDPRGSTLGYVSTPIYINLLKFTKYFYFSELKVAKSIIWSSDSY